MSSVHRQKSVFTMSSCPWLQSHWPDGHLPLNCRWGMSDWGRHNVRGVGDKMCCCPGDSSRVPTCESHGDRVRNLTHPSPPSFGEPPPRLASPADLLRAFPDHLRHHVSSRTSHPTPAPTPTITTGRSAWSNSRTLLRDDLRADPGCVTHHPLRTWGWVTVAA